MFAFRNSRTRWFHVPLRTNWNLWKSAGCGGFHLWPPDINSIGGNTGWKIFSSSWNHECFNRSPSSDFVFSWECWIWRLDRFSSSSSFSDATGAFRKKWYKCSDSGINRSFPHGYRLVVAGQRNNSKKCSNRCQSTQHVGILSRISIYPKRLASFTDDRTKLSSDFFRNEGNDHTRAIRSEWGCLGRMRL